MTAGGPAPMFASSMRSIFGASVAVATQTLFGFKIASWNWVVMAQDALAHLCLEMMGLMDPFGMSITLRSSASA